MVSTNAENGFLPPEKVIGGGSSDEKTKQTCCSECRRTDGQLRDELRFFSHQMLQLMRAFCISSCRCSNCDSFVLRNNNGDDLLDACQFRNKYDELSNNASLCAKFLTAARLHQQFGYAHLAEPFQSYGLSAAVNGSLSSSSPLSSSSTSSSADKVELEQRKEDTSSSKSMAVELASENLELKKDDDCRSRSATPETIRPHKRAIIGVDQLLPKLLANEQQSIYHYQSHQNGRMTHTPSSSSSLLLNGLKRLAHPLSSSVDSASMPCSDRIDSFDDEINVTNDDDEHESTPTPPMSNAKLANAIAQLSAAQRHSLSSLKLALINCDTGDDCVSPPPAKLLRKEILDDKPVVVTNGLVERSCFLSNQSPCSSSGSVELPKSCIDRSLENSRLAVGNHFENGYAHHHHQRQNDMTLPPGWLPTTSGVSDTLRDQHLKGLAPVIPSASACLPLVMHGAKSSTFFCTICNREFSSVYYKRHMIVHANARPYVCDVCNKRFNERSNMMKHKQRLHGS